MTQAARVALRILNQQAREKAEKDARTAENRVVFGRPKKAKTLQEKRKRLEESRHEGHRLERDDPQA